VQTSATVQSLTVDPASVTITSQDATQQLTVTGLFSDGVSRDVSSSALGTKYASADPTIATVGEDGLITAIGRGITTVTVTNGSATLVENVIVNQAVPAILVTSPGTTTKNQTVPVDLKGENLGGATSLQFLINGQPDPNVNASNIAVSSDGTDATATVLVGANAMSGVHTIVMTTPGGQSDTLASYDAAGLTVTGGILHSFAAGLQMIAAPVDDSAFALSQLFDASVSKMAVWDPATYAYAINPTAPADTIRPGRGYWIRPGSATNLLDLGTVPSTSVVSVALSPGWNMIGNPRPTSVSVGTLSVTDQWGNSYSFAGGSAAGLNWTTVYTYQAGDTQYEVQTGANASLAAYTGYWLYAFKPCTLVFPAAQ
jgi:hypothetical protein